MSFRRVRRGTAARLPALAAALLIALLAAACNSPATPDPSAQATIAALATSNAQLSTQVAELAAAAGLPVQAAAAQTSPLDTPAQAAVEASAPVEEAPAPAEEAAAVAVPAPSTAPATAPVIAQPGTGPLPQLLAEIPLAPAGETLYDLRIDRAANRIFVTDSAGQLHVLDATTYAPLTVLPYGGWLELDSEHNRLYVYKPYITQEESLIHVIDTQTLDTVGTIPGRAIAVDSANNRLFVGEPYVISLEPDAPGVRVVDGATLQQTGIFTQAGAPTYNPLRNELLIAAYTVYSADPDTQQVKEDLFPELTDMGEGGFLWCNSCPWVDEIHFSAADQVVAVIISRHCTGGGCGRADESRYFDAATMQQIAPAVAPQVQANCGSQAGLVNAVDGRRYINETYMRYVVYNNLLVTDEAGALLAERDGLRIDYVNPRTGQGYLYDGTVLDLAALLPIGRWPAACLLAEEPAGGLLFGYRSGSLYVIAERGGEAPPAPPPAAEPLPAEWAIRQIAVSPNYALDNTLLAVSGGGIYRSTDSGEQWQRLRGGLPEAQESNWVVAFSPNYASDRTVFAGGDRSEAWGEGVWRSTDGGDLWQPQWTDLAHRRINNFYLAPTFDSNAADAAGQTLVVQAAYDNVVSGQGGDSYQQSTDGGLSWRVVATSTEGSSEPSALPPLSELLPGYQAAPELPVRTGNLRDAIQVTLDGSTWITVPLQLLEMEWLHAVLASPRYPDDPALYVFGNYSLWRSNDNGATWSAWEDARLDGMDYRRVMGAAAVSLVTADGGYRLFVGTANGEVWVLDPAQMSWSEPVAAEPQALSAAAAAAPSPTPGATAALTPAATVTATTAVTTAVTPTVTVAVTPAVTAAVTAAVTTTAPSATLSTPTPPAAAGTPTPAVTAEPLAGEPPAGLHRPQGSLGIMWDANARIQQELGWARQESPAVVSGAYQLFDNGTMIWRSDTQQIFVFLNDGTWQSFADTFEEGDPEFDPSLSAPGGKQQPIRGFGKVWRENAVLRDQLGWAIAKEQAQQSEIQPFERGQMMRFGGLVFTVLGVDTAKGRWH